MSFARRLAACVLAISAMSVLAALLWDGSDVATRESAQASTLSQTAQP